jgi:hypothetical protein
MRLRRKTYAKRNKKAPAASESTTSPPIAMAFQESFVLSPSSASDVSIVRVRSVGWELGKEDPEGAVLGLALGAKMGFPLGNTLGVTLGSRPSESTGWLGGGGGSAGGKPPVSPS